MPEEGPSHKHGHGNAITVSANNVVIDFNDFKLGNLAAGEGTQAVGIKSNGYVNISIRNGTIRGFLHAIFVQVATPEAFANHRIENMLIDTTRGHGIALLNGKGSVVERNRLSNIGLSTNDVVAGILVQTAPATVVDDNVVSTVQGKTYAAGIYVISSSYSTIS